MKALLCTGPGKPEDLAVAEVPDPVAGPGEAVVRVEAAALNFFDLLIIAGKYQYKPAFPFSPGAEFAGTIESLGEGVGGFAAGDRVIGQLGVVFVAAALGSDVRVVEGAHLRVGAGARRGGGARLRRRCRGRSGGRGLRRRRSRDQGDGPKAHAGAAGLDLRLADVRGMAFDNKPSYPAHAGYPVRRGISIPSLTPGNTGSPAFADDDD